MRGAPCSLPDSGNGVGTRLSSHPPAAENETRRAATAQPGRGRRSRRGSPPPRPHSVHRPPPPSDAPPSSSCPRPRFAPLPPGGPFLLCLGQARLLIPPGPLPERSSIPALVRIRCECHLLREAFPDCPDGSAPAKAGLVAVWSAHRCPGPRTRKAGLSALCSAAAISELLLVFEHPPPPFFCTKPLRTQPVLPPHTLMSRRPFGFLHAASRHSERSLVHLSLDLSSL